MSMIQYIEPYGIHLPNNHTINYAQKEFNRNTTANNEVYYNSLPLMSFARCYPLPSISFHKPSSTDIPSAPQRLSLNDFVIKETIGVGSSGRVHIAKSKWNNQYYAIKAIAKKKICSQRDISHLRNEKQIQSTANSPFLVKLWDTFQTDTHLFFVMEYILGGELFSIIRDNHMLMEDHARFYAAEVLLGLEYLHKLDIAYRDLKPENILIDRYGHVKITDFGYAKVVTDITWTICGTPDYLAPEVIRNKGYTKSVDWWSFGVLIYEMLTGNSPFHSKNPTESFQKILECQIDWPESISPEAKDLITHLLQVNPTERFNAEDIKNHAWFQSINFEDVYACKMTPPIIPKVQFNGDTRYFDDYQELKLPYIDSTNNTYDPFFNF